MWRCRWFCCLSWHISILFIGLVIGSVLLLVGCGPRIGGGEAAAHLAGRSLAVDLPALYIDYNRAGGAQIGSVPVAAVGDSFGIDLSPLNLDAAQLQPIIDANIQHIQVTTLPGRLLILVNGRVVPSLQWSENRWATTGTTAAELFPEIAPLIPLLPIAAEMGGGITLRFPLSGSVSPIPLTMVEPDHSALQADQDAYLAAIGGVPPQLGIDVFYENDGTWVVNGLDAAGWHESVPLPWERLNLTPREIETLQAGGIETLTFRSDRQGLYVTVNGEPFPHLSWANGELQNLIVLADEGGLFHQLLGDTPTAYSLAVTLERLLPMLQITEIELRVHFADKSIHNSVD